MIKKIILILAVVVGVANGEPIAIINQADFDSVEICTVKTACQVQLYKKTYDTTSAFTSATGDTLLYHWNKPTTDTTYINLGHTPTAGNVFKRYFGKSNSNRSTIYKTFYQWFGNDASRDKWVDLIKTAGADIIISDSANNYESEPRKIFVNNKTLVFYGTTRGQNAHGFAGTSEIVMRTSSDTEVTWSRETTIVKYNGPSNEKYSYRPVSVLSKNINGVNKIFLFYRNWDSLGTQQDVHFITSTDTGHTWSAINEMYDTSTANWYGYGDAVITTTGRMLVPLYDYKTSEYNIGIFYADSPYTSWSVVKKASPASMKLNESSIYGLKQNGVLNKWVCLSRNETSPYVYFDCYSTDNGATWSDWDTARYISAHTDPNPISFVRDDMDNLFGFYGNINGQHVYTSDEGVTWKQELNYYDSISTRHWTLGGAGHRLYPSPTYYGSGKIGIAWCTNRRTASIISDMYSNFFDSYNQAIDLIGTGATTANPRPTYTNGQWEISGGTTYIKAVGYRPLNGYLNPVRITIKAKDTLGAILGINKTGSTADNLTNNFYWDNTINSRVNMEMNDDNINTTITRIQNAFVNFNFIWKSDTIQASHNATKVAGKNAATGNGIPNWTSTTTLYAFTTNANIKVKHLFAYPYVDNETVVTLGVSTPVVAPDTLTIRGNIRKKLRYGTTNGTIDSDAFGTYKRLPTF